MTAAPAAGPRAAATSLDALADLVGTGDVVVLSGAGLSTESGIPDYRGPTSVRATPMLYQEFVRSVDNRRRYWARSYRGWSRMGHAEPNAGHRALAALEPAGLIGIVTQNVDGLHQRAGSSPVIPLHGAIADDPRFQWGRAKDRKIRDIGRVPIWPLRDGNGDGAR